MQMQKKEAKGKKGSLAIKLQIWKTCSSGRFIKFGRFHRVCKISGFIWKFWKFWTCGSGLEVALGRLFGLDFWAGGWLVGFVEVGYLEGRFMFETWAASFSMHKVLKTSPLSVMRSLIVDESSGREKISCFIVIHC